MILYYCGLDKNLSDFGIEIPLAANRAKQVFDTLKKDFPEQIFITEEEKIIPLGQDDLLLAHQEEFVERLFTEPEVELVRCYESEESPSRELVSHVLKAAGGSFLAMEQALKSGFCFFLSGGMHHARSNRASGFCLVNDIVIGIRKLQKKGIIKNAWVIDVDAHKGDGSAEICLDDSSITTFSLHMAAGWPLDTDLIDVPSDIDIGIEEGKEENYLTLLQEGLTKLDTFESPQLAVVVAGADPYEHDSLESAALLKLSKEQLLERDQTVFNWLQKKNIPQCWLAAGGYGSHSWEIYYQFLAYRLSTT